MDKIKSLETFVRVADLNGFARAAESLGLSRASVTRTVAELEETMHLRLFNRTTRSVSLTSDGERVLEEAREILRRTDEMFASPGSSELTGRLRVAATTSFAEFFLCGILEEFGEKHPGLSIELLASDRVRYSAAGLIRDAVLRGNGIACLPDIAGEGEEAAERLVQILPEWHLPTRDIYALFPALKFIHRGAHLLAEEVESRINARSGGAGS